MHRRIVPIARVAPLAMVLGLLLLPSSAAQECPSAPQLHIPHEAYTLDVPLGSGESHRFAFSLWVRCEGGDPDRLRAYDVFFGSEGLSPSSVRFQASPAAMPIPDGPCPTSGWWNLTTEFELSVDALTRARVYTDTVHGGVVCGTTERRDDRSVTYYVAYEPGFTATIVEDPVRVSSVGRFEALFDVSNQGNAPVLVDWEVQTPFEDEESFVAARGRIGLESGHGTPPAPESSGTIRIGGLLGPEAPDQVNYTVSFTVHPDLPARRPIAPDDDDWGPLVITSDDAFTASRLAHRETPFPAAAWGLLAALGVAITTWRRRAAAA